VVVAVCGGGDADQVCQRRQHEDAAGCWDVVVFRNGDTTAVLRTRLTAAAVTHDQPAGDAIPASAFNPTAFRPQA